LCATLSLKFGLLFVGTVRTAGLFTSLFFTFLSIYLAFPLSFVPSPIPSKENERKLQINLAHDRLLPHSVSVMKKQAYKILQNSTGERFVRLANGITLPAATAGMCAGPDRWLGIGRYEHHQHGR
jgi:hypothetical protein